MATNEIESKRKYLFKDFNVKEIGGKSLNSFLSVTDMFKRSDTNNATFDDGFTKRFKGGDGPMDFYFRLFFYFDQIDGAIEGARLLGTDVDMTTLKSNEFGNSIWESLPSEFDKIHAGRTYLSNDISNSALNFLLLNCEYERAEKLLKFIYLLSYISTFESWQFQQISGVNDALTRNYFSNGELKLEEQRKALTIKCLPSGYNQNVATLLDLYRDVCFSYIWKKEIVPANLRKFNMGLFIFSTPVRSKNIINVNGKNVWKSFDIPNPNYYADGNNTKGENLLYCNTKYIEFRNCEIDYNSNVGTYSDLNNAEGKEMANEIKIYYDDVSELRYDENFMRVIGDKCFQDYDFQCTPGYWQTDDTYTAEQMIKKTDSTYNMTVGNLVNESINSNINNATEKLGNIRNDNNIKSVNEVENFGNMREMNINNPTKNVETKNNRGFIKKS